MSRPRPRKRFRCSERITLGEMKRRSPQPDLLPEPETLKPLAERMRPRALDDFVGQDRLLAPGTAFRRAIESGRVHSMILWGPPGCGKTSLARVLAHYAESEFLSISAVLGGLAEVRAALAEAAQNFAAGKRTVLFVDEVHRFRGSGLLSNWQKPVCMQRLNLDAA